MIGRALGCRGTDDLPTETRICGPPICVILSITLVADSQILRCQVSRRVTPENIRLTSARVSSKKGRI